MKKLLTILLTLVMAVCLNNLNNSHTRAEETEGNDIVSGFLVYEDNDGWSLNGEGITVDADPTSNELGITQIADTVTFTKEIVINQSGTSFPAMIVATGNEAPVILIMNKNLEINKTTNNEAPAFNTKNVGINGNGNTLTINSQYSQAHNENGTGGSIFQLININVIAEGKSTDAAFDVGKLILDTNTNCTLSITNNGTGPALHTTKVITTDIKDKYDFLGTTDRSKAESDLQQVVRDTDGIFKIGTVPANYVLIRPKSQPKPDPTPSQPKDESCEKVIGPTWHWNNDKGICEDYGVVGTATR